MEKLKKKRFNNKPWNNQNITDKLVGTHGTGHKGILLSNTHSLRICDRSLDVTFSIRGVKAINQSKTCEYMFKSGFSLASWKKNSLKSFFNKSIV